MKKVIEVDKQQLASPLEARIAALEARVEKLDPRPRQEVLEPYGINEQVYSVVDLEARNPLRVCGYDHRTGSVLIMLNPGDPAGPRPVSLRSVRRLEQCPRAQPGPDQLASHITDQKTTEFWQGRRRAQTEAKTSPILPPPPPRQRRYGEQDQIPTYGLRPSIGTGE